MDRIVQHTYLGLLGIGSSCAVASKLAHGGKHFRTRYLWFGLAGEGFVLAQIAIGGVLEDAPKPVGGCSCLREQGTSDETT